MCPKRQVGQNFCPLFTHAKWAERMHNSKKRFKTLRFKPVKRNNRMTTVNLIGPNCQRGYSSIGRALPLQARGSGIETRCFHFYIKKIRQSEVLILGPLGYEPNALATALLSLKHERKNRTCYLQYKIRFWIVPVLTVSRLRYAALKEKHGRCA